MCLSPEYKNGRIQGSPLLVQRDGGDCGGPAGTIRLMYRVVFLTGPPDFQYQNEKTCSVDEELFYIENFVKN